MLSPESTLYLLSFFYPSLNKAQATITEAKRIIEAVSHNDYRIVAMATGYCAIGFASDIPQPDIRERLKRLPANEAAYLLVEINRIVAGTMTEDTMRWWAQHVRR